ncbi:MAG TPA: zinc ribbon domain-containing protein [Candidatus Polarisedimenticolia bacterium]|nr:zinc ribbon domain-containing protein [Candidatus Polarisedimenticolia bacterium]
MSHGQGSAADPIEESVCPNCSRANDWRVDFCGRCGAPVGRFTTLDPLKAIYAEGWLLRKSATGRIGLFVLVGMWALLGIPAGGILAMIALHPEGTEPTVLLGRGAVSAILLLVLARVTLNYVRNRRRPGPYDPDRPRRSILG